MKKFYKLLSAVVLVAMLFSMLSVFASAAPIVIGEGGGEGSEAPGGEGGGSPGEESPPEEGDPSGEEGEDPEFIDYAAHAGVADEFGEIYCEYYNYVLNNIDDIGDEELETFEFLFGRTADESLALYHGGGMMLMSIPNPDTGPDDPTSKGAATVNGVPYTSLLLALKAAKGTTHKVIMLNTFNFSSTIPTFTLDLLGCTLVAPGDDPAICVHKGNLTVCSGTIESDGSDPGSIGVKATGSESVLNLYDLIINTRSCAVVAADSAVVNIGSGSRSATIKTTGEDAAIQVEDDSRVNINNAVVNNENGNALLLVNNGSTANVNAGATLKSLKDAAVKFWLNGVLNLNGGTIDGPVGVFMDGYGTLNVYSGTIESSYKVALAGTYNQSETAYGDTILFDGSAVIIHDDAGSPFLNIAGGKLQPAANVPGALSIRGYHDGGAGAAPDAKGDTGDNKVIIAEGADVDNVTRDIYSEFNPVASLNGDLYDDLQEAIDYAAAWGMSESERTVKLLTDVLVDVPVDLKYTVILDGDGHEIRADAGFVGPMVVNITGDNAVLKNVIVDGNNMNINGIRIFKSSGVTLRDVEVRNCAAPAAAVVALASQVQIDGLETDSKSPLGIGVTDDGTTFSDVTIKSCLLNNTTSVDVDPGNTLRITGGKVRDKDSFTNNMVPVGSTWNKVGVYYVLSFTDPTIIYLGTGSAQFDKGDANRADMVFKVSAPVDPKVTLTSESGWSQNLQGVYNSVKKTLTLDKDDLDTLSAGSYKMTVDFIGIGSYDYEFIYIIPVAPYLDPQVQDGNGKDLGYARHMFGDKTDIYVIMDETADRIGISIDKNINNITFFDNSGFVSPQEFLLPYGVLDSYPAGTYYIFAQYGENIFIPMTLIIGNESASITPTEATWGKGLGNLVFTVKPDVLSVSIGGHVLGPSDYSFKNNKLTINASFLDTLAYGTYAMVVTTSAGDVSATIKIGVSLVNYGTDSHTYGGSHDLMFKCSDRIDAVYVGLNKVLVDTKYYTLSADGKTLTLKAEYLNKLPVGTYTIYVDTPNGPASCGFKIISATTAGRTPATGDTSNIIMWVILMVLSAVAIIVLVLPKFRKKKSD